MNHPHQPGTPGRVTITKQLLLSFLESQNDALLAPGLINQEAFLAFIGWTDVSREGLINFRKKYRRIWRRAKDQDKVALPSLANDVVASRALQDAVTTAAKRLETDRLDRVREALGDAIMQMTDAEIVAYVRRNGEDPNKIAADMRRSFEALMDRVQGAGQ